MTPFPSDFSWQKRFIPTICRIVGPHLMAHTSLEVDQTEATDFMVLVGRDMRIAARVRRASYAAKYPKDVTIRSRRDTHARTEWAKVFEDGFGDWMFYGFDAGSGLDVYPFILLDLHVLRELWATHGEDVLAAKNISNGDGTYFNVIRPGDLTREPFFRSDLIIAWEHSDRVDAQTGLFDSARQRRAA